MIKNILISLLKAMPYKWRRKLDHCMFVANYEEQRYTDGLKRFYIKKGDFK